MHVFQDVLDHLGALAGGVQRQCVVTLGAFTDVLDVGLGTGPPDAVQLVTREAGGLGFLQRRRVHHAPAPQQHIVRMALAHLQPGGFLFDARRGHRQQLQLEAVHARALLQQRNWLLAKRAVVVDQRNLLALELVQAAFDLAQVLDQDVGAGPVAAHQREVPLEGVAVLRDGQTIAQRDQRNLVGDDLFGQREGNARRLRVEQGDAGMALQAFVAFDTAVGGVAGFAFLVGQLDAVHAAVTRIDHLQVILLAIGPGHAVRGVGAGAVGKQREELLLGVRVGRAGPRCGGGGHDGGSQQEFR